MRTIGIGAGSAKCFVVEARIGSGEWGRPGPHDSGGDLYAALRQPQQAASWFENESAQPLFPQCRNNGQAARTDLVVKVVVHPEPNGIGSCSDIDLRASHN